MRVRPKRVRPTRIRPIEEKARVRPNVQKVRFRPTRFRPPEQKVRIRPTKLIINLLFFFPLCFWKGTDLFFCFKHFLCPLDVPPQQLAITNNNY